MTPIILASGSAIRADILRAAGVSFTVEPPAVDESAIKRAGLRAGHTIEAIATTLAIAKARAIAAPGALIIGADQILEFDGAAFDKPTDLSEARARLLALAGRTHTLVNAVVVAQDGEIVFRNIDRPTLTMRALSPDDIDAYLAAAGPAVLTSVGAYQVERLGARLFERIDGDHFSVLGLSLFPLLGFLRQRGALAF